MKIRDYMSLYYRCFILGSPYDKNIQNICLLLMDLFDRESDRFIAGCLSAIKCIFISSANYLSDYR